MRLVDAGGTLRADGPDARERGDDRAWWSVSWRAEVPRRTDLDVRTNNLPDGYSARVSVGTNNGRLAVDFPVTVQGRVDPRRLELTLGGGGAPVRVTTNNGGARLGRVE